MSMYGFSSLEDEPNITELSSCAQVEYDIWFAQDRAQKQAERLADTHPLVSFSEIVKEFNQLQKEHKEHHEDRTPNPVRS